MNRKTKTFIIAIVIALGVGGLSALATMGNMDIYSEINMPPLSPPSVLFPIVWTVLYLLMGISSAPVYLNRKEDPAAAKSGLTVYAISLVFNFFWSIIFFNLRAFTFAFWWLIVLWVLIIATIYYYKKVSPKAAYLQIPYFLWVTFAAYLNLAISILN